MTGGAAEVCCFSCLPVRKVTQKLKNDSFKSCNMFRIPVSAVVEERKTPHGDCPGARDITRHLQRHVGSGIQAAARV